MADPSVATPGSTADSGTPAKGPTAKDRRCDFCGQFFTSSSLGRHLDLYVKEKNPKPPDGVHDVDEIRRMRGNITRRQARNSSAKRETSTPTVSKPSPMNNQRSPSIGRGQIDGPHPEGVRARFNAANWQATGVINGLPPTPRQGQVHVDMRRDSSRRTSVKSDFVRRQAMMDDTDTGRAAELALRELLGSLRAASARSQPAPSPLDFDPFSLTFPALCLRCLHAPPTLFSGQPFSTSTSWSLEAPGPAQLDPLRQYVQETFRRWRTERAVVEGRKEQRNLANGHVNGYNQSDQQAQQEQDRVMKHLTSAFNHWKALSEKQKQESWRLEILRAYAREQEKNKSTITQLEKAEQEVLHLRAQVDRLSKCQQPRDFLLFPPTTIPIPQETVKDLHRAGMDLSTLDYDQIVDKWKTVIQRNRKSTSSLSAQRPLPNTNTTPQQQQQQQQRRNFSTPLNSTNPMMNGHSNLHTPNHDNGNLNDDEDLEDADADGEGEDQDHHPPPPPQGRAPQAVMDRGVLDPSLQGHHHADGMVLDGIEGNGGMDPEGFLHGQMLMGLSAGEFGTGMNGDHHKGVD